MNIGNEYVCAHIILIIQGRGLRPAVRALAIDADALALLDPLPGRRPPV